MGTLEIVQSYCECGRQRVYFHNRDGESVYGCPNCDNSTDPTHPSKEWEEIVSNACTLDNVLYRLQQLRQKYGNVRVMISLDGDNGAAVIPYLPVNTVGVDDDDPKAPVALLCVAKENHPLYES